MKYLELFWKGGIDWVGALKINTSNALRECVMFFFKVFPLLIIASNFKNVKMILFHPLGTSPINHNDI
jgi:hypothetical protein